MTNLSIFDKICKKWTKPTTTLLKRKQYTSLSANDKMGHFRQYWKKWKKKKTPIRASQIMTKLSLFDKIVWYITTHSVHTVYLYLSHNLKSTCHKWQNGQFLTKLKFEVHFSQITKWTIFDKLEKVKKKPQASLKMTKLSVFDKIEESKHSTVLSQNDKIEHFCQNWISVKIHGPLTQWQNGAFLTKLKNRKNPRRSHKMTKLSIFDKIEES